MACATLASVSVLSVEGLASIVGKGGALIVGFLRGVPLVGGQRPVFRPGEAKLPLDKLTGVPSRLLSFLDRVLDVLAMIAVMTSRLIACAVVAD